MSNDPAANMASLTAYADDLDEGESTLVDRRTLCEWLSAMSLQKWQIARLRDALDDAAANLAGAHQITQSADILAAYVRARKALKGEMRK